MSIIGSWLAVSVAVALHDWLKDTTVSVFSCKNVELSFDTRYMIFFIEPMKTNESTLNVVMSQEQLL